MPQRTLAAAPGADRAGPAVSRRLLRAFHRCQADRPVTGRINTSDAVRRRSAQHDGVRDALEAPIRA